MRLKRSHNILMIGLLMTGLLLQGFGADVSSAEETEAKGTWIYEGQRQFAADGALPEMSYDSNGQLYVKYLSGVKSGNGTPAVKRYNGVEWDPLPVLEGAPKMSSSSISSSFVIDHDIPHMAYRGMNNDIYVSKFTGNQWEEIGGPVFVSSGPALNYIALTVVNETPYLSYSGTVNGASVWQIKKYTDGAWTLIASPEATHPSDNASFAADSSGGLYVGYNKSNDVTRRATVKKYNPDSDAWEEVGSSNFTGGALTEPKLILDGDTLYFAYIGSAANGRKLSVMSHRADSLSGEWTTVGDDVSEERVGSYVISAQGGEIYAVYRNYNAPNTVSAKKLVSTGDGREVWQQLGESLSMPMSSLIDMVVLDGVPYISFLGDSKTGSLSIMKYSDADFKLWGDSRDSAVKLEWDAAEGGTGYILYKDGVQIATAGRQENSEVISQLENNRQYRFLVRTVDGRSSNEITITPSAVPPAVPGQVRAVSVDHGQVTVSWNPVTADTGAAALGYEIYMREATESSYPGIPAVTVSGNEISSYTIREGLMSGRTVYFKVRAFNDSGTSGWSEEVNATPSSSVWESLGTVSSSSTMDNSLVVNDGTPFLAFVENGKVTVKKYTPTGWEVVGSPGFINGGVGYTSLAFCNNVPYVASTDEHNSVTVMKYTGKGTTKWETVGAASFVDKQVDNIALAFDKQGTPYVAFNVQPLAGQEPGAMVMKYSGNGTAGWELVGEGIISIGAAGTYVSLFVDGLTPYVAFRDNNANRGTVMMFDGSGWVALGGRGFTKDMTTAKAVKWTSVFVYDGTPYLAFRDVGPNLVKYNGVNWEYVGSKNFEGDANNDLNYTRLFIDQGIPYLLFRSAENGGKAIVMKYTGKGATGWEYIGNKSFSLGAVDHPSLYVQDGIVYAAFSDLAQSGGDYKTVVMRFDDSASAPAVPLNVTAGARSGKAELGWTASPNADHYRVYMRTAEENYGAPLAEVTDPGFTANQLENGITYYFAVSAYSEEAGESGKSMEVAVTPFNTAAPPLAAPIEVRAGNAPGRAVVSTAVYDAVYHELQLVISALPLQTPDILLDHVPVEATTLSKLPAEISNVEAGMYIGIYETDAEGSIYRFSSRLLQRDEVAPYPVRTLELTLSPGKAQGTTTVQAATYAESHTLAVQVSAGPAAVPFKGDLLPDEADAYQIGRDIPVTAGSHVVIYELGDDGLICGFAQSLVTAEQIYTAAAPSTSQPVSTAEAVNIQRPDLFQVDEAWALEELNKSGASVLSLNLKDTEPTPAGGKSVILTQPVIRRAVELSKSFELLDRGAKWIVPAELLYSEAAEEVTLTIMNKQPDASPADTEGRALYSIAASIGSLTLPQGKSAPITVQLPVPEGESEADKLVIYGVDEKGNWLYVDSQVSGGFLHLQMDHWGTALLAKSDKTFADLSGHWAKHTIEVMAARGIANGVGADAFAPDQTVNRAEFAVMLARMLKLDGQDSRFTDVQAEAWYAAEVNAAAAAGIIHGTGGVFRPLAPLSRQEMAVMIMRAYYLQAADIAPSGPDPSFADGHQIGKWAEQAVHEAAGLRLIEGRSGGVFVPGGNATRAEGMTVLYRLMELMS